jgi:hypothetical protein
MGEPQRVRCLRRVRQFGEEGSNLARPAPSSRTAAMSSTPSGSAGTAAPTTGCHPRIDQHDPLAPKKFLRHRSTAMPRAVYGPFPLSQGRDSCCRKRRQVQRCHHPVLSDSGVGDVRQPLLGPQRGAWLPASRVRYSALGTYRRRRSVMPHSMRPREPPLAAPQCGRPLRQSRSWRSYGRTHAPS